VAFPRPKYAALKYARDDRFFPSGVGRNPLDGEVNFDEAFGILCD
jgi:hypothetical protein